MPSSFVLFGKHFLKLQKIKPWGVTHGQFREKWVFVFVVIVWGKSAVISDINAFTPS